MYSSKFFRETLLLRKPGGIEWELCPVNRKFATAISDARWSQMMRQIAYKSYKSLWYGRKFFEFDRWFPGSKTCSCCGHIVEKLSLNVREWDYSKCKGFTMTKIVNAALNHLAA